jgi:hypothetical protein
MEKSYMLQVLKYTNVFPLLFLMVSVKSFFSLSKDASGEWVESETPEAKMMNASFESYLLNSLAIMPLPITIVIE